ncbi:MAG TPA: hypothetical protein VNT53_09320 [Pseudolysinimonas sp.]|nr:hypothetical protein [Pseudolysinimonas sp.]
MATDKDFAALAEQLTDPSTPMPKGSDISAGAVAATHGRKLMAHEYGSEGALDAVLRRAGRTRLGEQPKGASPTVRGRLSEADYAAFKLLEMRSGKRQSELVRESIHRLLVAEGMLPER